MEICEKIVQYKPHYKYAFMATFMAGIALMVWSDFCTSGMNQDPKLCSAEDIHNIALARVAMFTLAAIFAFLYSSVFFCNMYMKKGKYSPFE